MPHYSLASYILTIQIPDEVALKFGTNTISIGGQGSYVGSISLANSKDTFSTVGDDTGGWIHNKSLDRTGSATISLNQLAESVGQLIRLFNIYFNLDDVEGLTLTLTSSAGKLIATGTDSLVTRIPNQDFNSTASEQSWTLTIGQLIFNS
jgi:hypothetical protein